jgi:hypothetical protein
MEIGIFCQCLGPSLGNKKRLLRDMDKTIQCGEFPINTTNERNIASPPMLTLEKDTIGIGRASKRVAGFLSN